LNLGGFFACVFPTEQLARVETAAGKAGLTIVRRRPVVLKEGEEPLISLFGMMVAGICRPGFGVKRGWNRL